MLGCRVIPVVLASAITLVVAAQAKAQDAAAGEKVFKNNCGICHSPQPGRNMIGPSLFSVVDRHSGQIPGFHYSDANLNSGLTWNVTTLDRYIAGPRELVQGARR